MVVEQCVYQVLGWASCAAGRISFLEADEADNSVKQLASALQQFPLIQHIHMKQNLHVMIQDGTALETTTLGPI